IFSGLIFSLLSCSKDDKSIDQPITEIPTSLKGKIIYEYSSDVQQIDLATGNESSYFSYNAYSTIGWDFSKDGKFRLMSERPPGTYSITKFKLINADEGTIVKEFDYSTKYGSNTKMGYLSHDNSLILLQPDFDN